MTHMNVRVLAVVDQSSGPPKVTEMADDGVYAAALVWAPTAQTPIRTALKVHSCTELEALLAAMFSMLAAEFGTEHVVTHIVKAAAGLRVPEAPTVDVTNVDPAKVN